VHYVLIIEPTFFATIFCLFTHHRAPLLHLSEIFPACSSKSSLAPPLLRTSSMSDRILARRSLRFSTAAGWRSSRLGSCSVSLCVCVCVCVGGDHVRRGEGTSTKRRDKDWSLTLYSSPRLTMRPASALFLRMR